MSKRCALTREDEGILPYGALTVTGAIVGVDARIDPQG